MDETLSDLDRKFWDFHHNNPIVFNKLEKLAADAYKTGRKKIGIGMLFEVLRWYSMFEVQGEAYKLNNSYRSRYTRILIDAHPEYRSMFETRRIKS